MRRGLVAGGGLARVDDHLVRHQADADDVGEFAAQQQGPDKLPELRAVVATQPHVPEDAPQRHEAAPDVAPRRALRAVSGHEPIPISRGYLMAVAVEQWLRRVGTPHAVAPD